MHWKRDGHPAIPSLSNRISPGRYASLQVCMIAYHMIAQGKVDIV